MGAADDQLAAVLKREEPPDPTAERGSGGFFAAWPAGVTLPLPPVPEQEQPDEREHDDQDEDARVGDDRYQGSPSFHA